MELDAKNLQAPSVVMMACRTFTIAPRVSVVWPTSTTTVESLGAASREEVFGEAQPNGHEPGRFVGRKLL